MLLTQLCQITGGQTNCPGQSFSGFNIDSRRIKEGNLFIAIQGQRLDGHEFIEEAFANGAAAALVTCPIAKPYVSVTDTTMALGQMALHHRQQFAIPLIAITGSCGKTTVKEMIHHILKERYEVLCSAGNLNNQIGVPLTLLALNADHEIAVLELGASQTGDIAYAAAIAQPNVAVITNIANAHLAGFKSEYGVAVTKSEIFQYTKPSGRAIINIDTMHTEVLQNKAQHLTIQTFGTKPQANFFIKKIDIQAHSSQCVVNTPKGEATIELTIPGACNAYNAVAAMAATFEYVNPDLIMERLQSYQSITGRLKLIELSKEVYIIDDTYNANPYATEQALIYLSSLPGKKIFVFGDMYELGPQAESLHAHIGKVAKQLAIDKCYTYGQLSAHTSQAFGTPLDHYDNKKKLVATLRKHLYPEVYILVKGSRSMAMDQILKDLLDGGI